MQLTRTRIQLVNEAAKKLNIIATGQVLEAEHEQALDDGIDPMLLQLAEEKICVVSNSNEIPTAWFDPLAAILGNRNAGGFGGQFDPAQDMYQKAVLKKLVSGDASFEITKAEYF